MEQLLTEHAEWIDKHLPDKQSPRITDGSSITIFGEPEVIKYALAEADSKPQITEFGEHIQVTAAGDHDQVLKKWLLRIARQGIIQRVEELAAQFEFKYNRVSVRDQSTRWGSCSSHRNLNFSWRLMFAPLIVMDYVIVHELAHTKHLNHSEKFWQEVERCMPDYKSHRHWLKQQGNELHGY